MTTTMSGDVTSGKGKSFTSRKLDWLTCVRFDRRINDHAYRVAATIADHLNEKTGRTMLSDDVIAFETGSKWPRKAVRARKLLRESGWLKWRRTRSANIYEPDYSRVNAMLATIAALRQQKRSKNADISGQIGHQRHMTKTAHLDVTPASDIHVSSTRYEEESGEEERICGHPEFLPSMAPTYGKSESDVPPAAVFAGQRHPPLPRRNYQKSARPKLQVAADLKRAGA
jgi:hypothetical protein